MTTTTSSSATGTNVLFEFVVKAADPNKVRRALIARARKVRALAERPGTPQEGLAARALLDRLLRENGLTLRDLDDGGPAAVTIIVRSGPRGPTGTWASVFRNAPEVHDDPRVVRQARQRRGAPRG